MAEMILKEKIAAIEDGIKDQKTIEIEAYFEELRSTMDLPDGIGTFEQTGFRIGLSTSVKKMREAATVSLKTCRRMYSTSRHLSTQMKYCWSTASA